MDKFFNIEYQGLAPLLLKCLLYQLVTLAVGYCFFFVLTRLLYRGHKHHQDHLLRLDRLWAISALMGLVGLYFYLLIRHIGFGEIDWLKRETWLGLLPLLLVYILLLIAFLVDGYNYRKQLSITPII